MRVDESDSVGALLSELADRDVDPGEDDVSRAFPEAERRTERDVVVLRETLVGLPIDDRSFRDRFSGADRTEVVERLAGWWHRHGGPQSADPILGAVGLLLLTLVGLEVSEQLRSGSLTASGVCHHHHDDLCHPLAGSPAVQEAIRRIYAPDPDHPSSESWSEIDFTDMDLHAHGTTSLIMKVESRAGSATLSEALKLVLLPHLRIPEVRRATESYYDTYKLSPDTSDLLLLHVRSSGQGWILSDFIVGSETLAEVLSKHAEFMAKKEVSAAPRLLQDSAILGRTRMGAVARRFVLEENRRQTDSIDITQMRKVKKALFNALKSNLVASEQQPGRPTVHGDLSLTNVLISSDSADIGVLIDFGTNYLYTRSIAAGDEGQAVFIAPEVKAGNDSIDAADIFSVGQLLIAAAGHRPTSPAVVPDAFYVWHPELARLLEDYIDADPRRRLSLLGDKGVIGLTTQRIDRMSAQLDFEFDAAEAARTSTENTETRSAQTITGLVRELRPLSGEPGRFRRMRRAMGGEWASGSNERADAQLIDVYVSDQRARTGSTLAWSAVAAAVSSTTIVLTFWWLLRNFDLDWGNWLTEVVQKLLRLDSNQFLVDGSRPDGFPDAHGASYYLPGLMTGVGYALVLAKLYQVVYARVSPIRSAKLSGLKGPAWAAEIWMRSIPLINSALVLWVVLWNVQMWPVAVIVGQTLAFVGNFAIKVYITRALRAAWDAPGVQGTTQALGLSTVPPEGRVTGVDNFKSWVAGSFFYASVCWVVGLLILSGTARDVLLYASIVTALNVVLLYVFRIGLNGPEMRVAFHRAAYAAERLATRP